MIPLNIKNDTNFIKFSDTEDAIKGNQSYDANNTSNNNVNELFTM